MCSRLHISLISNSNNPGKFIFQEYIYGLCDKLCKALGHLIGLHYSRDEDIDYDQYDEYYKD